MKGKNSTPILRQVLNEKEQQILAYEKLLVGASMFLAVEAFALMANGNEQDKARAGAMAELYNDIMNTLDPHSPAFEFFSKGGHELEIDGASPQSLISL